MLARELVGGREECGAAEVGQVRLGVGKGFSEQMEGSVRVQRVTRFGKNVWTSMR